ncbi:MAG TPA: GEVED domain-containing protein, partial [Saprospiraceae bacterium]|nr:GEVED domain-containing protein [Saprospiraceae bacterium]HRP40501.1 GEVED domain-containing protein [Saprospiraceae bacterium]
MRNFVLITLIAFFSGILHGQNRVVPEKIRQLERSGATFANFELFSKNTNSVTNLKYQQSASDVTVLYLDYTALAQINNDAPPFISVLIPYGEDVLSVKMYKENALSDQFEAYDNNGNSIDYKPGKYYRGIVDGDYTSLVAISFFDNNIIGVISTNRFGNIVIGKSTDKQDYISYSDRNLLGVNPFKCATEDLKLKIEDYIKDEPEKLRRTRSTTNCARIYYEIGNEIYLQFSSNMQDVLDWITGVQNNIGTLYDNDDIRVNLNEVKVWVTADPYTGSYSDNLYLFRDLTPTFDGDIAHLVKYPATTSVAFLNSLCSEYRYAYSGISLSYAQVPVYSWTIMAMSHEMGHGFGSPHTHACAWNGNNTAIDGCGPTAGYDEGCNAPLPSNGGTIMSYCHLVSGVGINFNNGFGPQPAALIQNTIDSKPCLGTDCVNPAQGCFFDVIDYVMPVTKVQLSNINNSSDNPIGSTTLQDFTGIIGNMNRGSSIPIVLEGESLFTDPYDFYFTVWIDWNHDGTWNNTDEMFQIGSITPYYGSGPKQVTGNITIPNSALIGNAKMRVVMNYGNYHQNACIQIFYGQAEDYTLYVLPATSGCNQLFISEYVEGSSSNKALEIYNPTNASVSLDGVKIKVFANGNVNPTTTIDLTGKGSITPYGTYVLVDQQANATLKSYANYIHTATLGFNGDDAIALEVNNVYVDVFGQIGFDPGTAWTSGGVTTLDKTLRRKASVTQGDTDGSNVFDPSAEWVQYSIDSFDGLGMHSSACDAPCLGLTGITPDNVSIINSTCNGPGCLVNGGVITAPVITCPAGSTLQYSTDNGSTWGNSLPVYAQTGPAQTIITRCSCDADNTIVSASSTPVSTSPGVCEVPSETVITITDNDCTSGTSGSIRASGCGTGTSLEWSEDGTTWSTTTPDYTTTAKTVYARCLDNITGCISTIASATTNPQSCSGGSQSVCFGDDFSDIVTGNSTSTSGSGTIWNGNTNFPTVVRAYQAGGAVRIGTASMPGSIESMLLPSVSGNITVNVWVKGWTTVEGQIKISIDGQDQTISYTAKMADPFEKITATFTGVTAGSKLKIETTAKRAFIDEVEVLCEVNCNLMVSATASPNPVCEGDVLTLSTGGGIGYSWSGPNSFASTDQNPVINNYTNANSGTYTVTVTDTNGCTASSSVVVTTKSSGCYTITISDPCSCNNDATIAGNDGTFDEQITVNGIAGQTITATCTGCTPSALTFSEGPAGTYVSNSFTHLDGVGYTATILENGTGVGTISNKCAYPDVVINPMGPFDNCINKNDSYPLTATITGDDGTGTYVWSGTGVSGSNFNYSGLPAGNININLSYTGVDNGHVSPDGGVTAAYPGCIQPAQTSVTINDGVTPPAIDDIEVCDGQSTVIIAPALGTTTVPVSFVWDFEANINGPGVSSNTTAASDAPVQSVGAGISSTYQTAGSGCTAAISLTGFDIANGSLADAVADAEYIEFCVGSPQLGVTYQGINAINWIHRRSGTGPISWAIVPVSNLSSPVLTGTISGTTCVAAGGTITQDPSETCYRLYYWGATNATGTVRISEMTLSADYEVASGSYNFYLVDPVLNPGTTPVATGLTYDPGTTVGTSPQTIFITVFDDVLNCESLPDSVTITVHPNPTLDINQPDYVCKPGTIDVISVDLGESPVGGSKTYYNTFNDAENKTNPITSGLGSVSQAGSIFVRYELPVTECYAIGEIIIDIRDLPASPPVPDSIIVCQGESTLITLPSGPSIVTTTWDFENGITGQGIVSDPLVADNGPVQTTGPGLQGVAPQSAGSGCSNAITATGFDAGNTSLADAVVSGDYFEFCIGGAAGGYTFDGVSAVNWRHRSSNTGPVSWALVAATNPNTAILTGTFTSAGNCKAAGGTIPLNTATCYRVYYWSASSVMGALRIDNFDIAGQYSIPLTYRWYNVDPDANPSATPVAIGSSYDPMTTPATSPQSIWVNVDNGCVSPASKIVVLVLPTPVANPVSNQALCSGASTIPVNFTGTPIGVQFNWTNNDPTIGLAASGSGNIPSFVAVNNTGSNKVATITVTPIYTFSNKTCTGTPITFTITVYPKPVPVINVSETSGLTDNDGTICAGDSATLSTSGGGTYVWSTGATTSSITVSPSSTTTYTVSVTTVNGCTGTATRTIVVIPVPVVNITVTENSGVVPNDGIIYTGSSATLTATGGGTYLWSTGATTASISVTPPSAGTYTYTVTVTNSNNCSAVAQATITVVDPPCYLVCSQDQTITLPPGECAYQLPNLVTMAGDCKNFTIEQVSGPKPGEFLPKGTYEIKYREVSNLGELIKECTFTVTVQGQLTTVKNLVCNNNLYISADENCQVSLNADMFLEGGPYGCYSDYIIKIWPNGIESNKYTIEQNVAINIPLGTHMFEIIDPVTGNRCWGNFKVEDKLAPVLACNCVDEDIITPITQFAGVLEETDPLFNRCGASYTPQYYDVTEFQVSATGSYTFSAVVINDSYEYIYENSFDPNNPCVNIVAQNDSPIMTATLTAGVKYYYVYTTYWEFDFINTYPEPYTVTVTSTAGTAQKVQNASTLPECQFKCYDLETVQAETV